MGIFFQTRKRVDSELQTSTAQGGRVTPESVGLTSLHGHAKGLLTGRPSSVLRVDAVPRRASCLKKDPYVPQSQSSGWKVFPSPSSRGISSKGNSTGVR